MKEMNKSSFLSCSLFVFVFLSLPVSISFFVWIESTSVGYRIKGIILNYWYVTHWYHVSSHPRSTRMSGSESGFTESNVLCFCLPNPQSHRAVSRPRILVAEGCHRFWSVCSTAEANPWINTSIDGGI